MRQAVGAAVGKPHHCGIVIPRLADETQPLAIRRAGRPRCRRASEALAMSDVSNSLGRLAVAARAPIGRGALTVTARLRIILEDITDLIHERQISEETNRNTPILPTAYPHPTHHLPPS